MSSTKPKHKHLIIDGYNIIHAWPDLKKTFTNIGIEAAREQLCKQLRLIHDIDGIYVTIVFDGKGDDITIERPTPEVTFSIIYGTKQLSADSLIEQLSFKTKKNIETIVATEDNSIRQTITTLGQTLLSSNDLLEWVNACEKKQNRNIKFHKKLTDEQWKQENVWDNLL